MSEHLQELSTGTAGLALRPLSASDWPTYEAVATRMVQHAIDAGDARGFEAVWQSWGHDFVPSLGEDLNYRFAIFLHDRLIGRVDLLAREQGTFGLSYWLAPESTRHGYATAAVRGVIAFASSGQLDCNAIVAGVKHDNAPSIALLRRLDFELFAELETHLRFRLALNDRSLPDAKTGLIITANASLSDTELNTLFASSWPGHVERAFRPVLARSLVHVSARLAARLVGFANVATDGGEHAFLLDPTVDPAFRRRGIGRALIQHAVAEVRARGPHWLHVDYAPELEPFYRSAGFQPTAAGLIRID